MNNFACIVNYSKLSLIRDGFGRQNGALRIPVPYQRFIGSINDLDSCVWDIVEGDAPGVKDLREREWHTLLRPGEQCLPRQKLIAGNLTVVHTARKALRTLELFKRTRRRTKTSANRSRKTYRSDRRTYRRVNHRRCVSRLFWTGRDADGARSDL